MLVRPIIMVAMVGMLLTLAFSSESSAQWRGFSHIGQGGMRVLGHGYSAGYHWRNPGHDSSYYNPYSEMNSRLFSLESGYEQFDSVGPGQHEPAGVASSALSVNQDYPTQPVQRQGRQSPQSSDEGQWWDKRSKAQSGSPQLDAAGYSRPASHSSNGFGFPGN